MSHSVLSFLIEPTELLVEQPRLELSLGHYGIVTLMQDGISTGVCLTDDACQLHGNDVARTVCRQLGKEKSEDGGRHNFLFDKIILPTTTFIPLLQKCSHCGCAVLHFQCIKVNLNGKMPHAQLFVYSSDLTHTFTHRQKPFLSFRVIKKPLQYILVKCGVHGPHCSLLWFTVRFCEWRATSYGE